MLDPSVRSISIPMTEKVKYVKSFENRDNLRFSIKDKVLTIQLPEIEAEEPDYIIELLNR